MDLSDAIRLRINNLLKEHNLTISKLSTLAGISRSTLTRFLNGQRNFIRLDMLEYISEALNMTIRDFFNDDVFNNIDMNEWINLF